MAKMSSEPTSRLLTETQRRLVGWALGFGAFIAIVGLSAATLLLLARLVSHSSGVLWPLATAGILALILRPAVNGCERRFHFSRFGSVLLLYGAFLLLLFALLIIIVPPLVEQALDFISFLPTFWANAVHYTERHYPAWIEFAQRQLANPAIKHVADTLAAESKTFLAHALPSLKAAGSGLLALGAFATQAALVPIYLFFFLLSRGEPTAQLGEHLPFLSPRAREDVVFLVHEFISIVVSFFRGQLLIGLIMGVLLAAGYSLVGLKFGLFLGLAIGVLNVVPYLGTIMGIAVTLPLAFFQPGGSWVLVGLVLLVKIVVQNIEGWFLTPKIMGDRTGLHPVVIIVAVFFWGTALNGILGMVLAIPLTAFFATVWRLAKRRYFSA